MSVFGRSAVVLGPIASEVSIGRTTTVDPDTNNEVILMKCKTLTFSLILSGLLLALTGCQSLHAGPPPSNEMSNDAVRCDKCQVTWLRTPYAKDGHSGAIGYHDTQKMECPDCKANVASFSSAGKATERHCKFCDGRMSACEVR